MKQKKLMFNFFVNRNWSKLTDTRKRAKILADNRKSHHPIETLTKRIEIHQSQITNDELLFPKRFAKMYKRRESEESAASPDFDWRRRKIRNLKTFLASQVGCYPQTAVKASII